MSKSRVSIVDVARKANVSVSTVSRALNNYSDMNEETRKRILKIVKELDYYPNSIARGLVKQKTNILGLMLSYASGTTLLDLYLFEFIQGILEKVNNEKYNVCLLGTGLNFENSTKRLLKQKFVDGVILRATESNNELAKQLEEWEIPFVSLGKFDIPCSENWYSVSSDDFGGAFKATSYLINLGHTKIGFIGENNFKVAGVQERLKGYKKALEAKLMNDQEELIINGDFTMESGFQGALKLLENKQRPSAIFAANDQMAIGVIKATHYLGIKVPEQLSLIGFDDLAIATFVYPSLTTVHQHIYELGTLAAQLLIDLVNGRKPKEKQIILPTTLIERDSCKALITNI